ncbi:MAG: hypothetical protein KF795_14220 [Labilithrix sp.]|nr:hypothetical protein [Labilithrix sp.]
MLQMRVNRTEGAPRLETLDLSETWTVLKQVSTPSIDPRAIGDFDEALKPFVQFRHRAQHGELYEDPETALLMIEQVFARFLSVARAFAPDWAERLFARDEQIESKLKGLERRIDAGWQVLIDYLRGRDKLVLQLVAYVQRAQSSETVSVLLGERRNEQSESMLAKTDLPLTSTTGLFGTLLTKQQVDDRDQIRRTRDRSSADASAKGPQEFLYPMGLVPAPPRERKLLPLEPGGLHVPATHAWLTLRLAAKTPPHLLLSAILEDFRVDFADANARDGVASGTLRCAVNKGTTTPESVKIAGTAHLTWEGVQESHEESPGRTFRSVEMDVALSVDEARDA